MAGIMAYTTALLRALEIWCSASTRKPAAITMSGNTNILQQIIWWDKKRFEDFVNSPEEQEWRVRPEVEGALSTIRKGTGIAPIDTPFEYIKDLQSDFPYEQIPFTNEYYDTLGIERPDGTEPEESGFEFRTVEFKVEKN